MSVAIRLSPREAKIFKKHAAGIRGSNGGVPKESGHLHTGRSGERTGVVVNYHVVFSIQAKNR